MRPNLFQIADAYFDTRPELVTHKLEGNLYSPERNPFIRSSETKEKGSRDITEKIILLLVQHHAGMSEQYLFSPQATAKVIYPMAGQERMHRHHYFELFGILDGQLDIRMEHTNKRYFPGDFCLINRSAFHAEQYANDYCAVYVSIRSDYFETLMSGKEATHYEMVRQFAIRNREEAGGEDSLDFSPVNSPARQVNLRAMDEILSIILSELMGRHTGYMDIVTGCLKRLLAHLEHPDNYSCVNTQYPTERADLCRAMLSYIHLNRRKVSRRELGEALNYNCNYLADLFREYMGISLSAYIRDICMQEAARLLLNTELPIHEIARIVGYENRTVFYQHFEKKYHVTPKVYRGM